MQQMTETYYKTKNYKVDYSTFGGIIFPSDYNTELSKNLNIKGSSIASRIISDRNFDNQCRKNMEIRMRKGEK